MDYHKVILGLPRRTSPVIIVDSKNTSNFADHVQHHLVHRKRMWPVGQPSATCWHKVSHVKWPFVWT